MAWFINIQKRRIWENPDTNFSSIWGKNNYFLFNRALAYHVFQHHNIIWDCFFSTRRSWEHVNSVICVCFFWSDRVLKDYLCKLGMVRLFYKRLCNFSQNLRKAAPSNQSFIYIYLHIHTNSDTEPSHVLCNLSVLWQMFLSNSC